MSCGGPSRKVDFHVIHAIEREHRVAKSVILFGIAHCGRHIWLSLHAKETNLVLMKRELNRLRRNGVLLMFEERPIFQDSTAHSHFCCAVAAVANLKMRESFVSEVS